MLVGCFIATAAYGSELSPQVQFLREFRDDVVLPSKSGRFFEKILDVYYFFSPSVANSMRKRKLLKYFIKYSIVWPFVALAKTTAFFIKFTINAKNKHESD